MCSRSKKEVYVPSVSFSNWSMWMGRKFDEFVPVRDQLKVTQLGNLLNYGKNDSTKKNVPVRKLLN